MYSQEHTICRSARLEIRFGVAHAHWRLASGVWAKVAQGRRQQRQSVMPTRAHAEWRGTGDHRLQPVQTKNQARHMPT